MSGEYLHVIVNPKSGHSRGAENVRRLTEESSRFGFDVKIIETQMQQHATAIAARLREITDLVVVMGGDGTISEAANALIQTPTTLGVIAVGTGNDIARSLGLPINDIAASLRVICRRRCRDIDVGFDGGRYFISLLGVGFPAIVAQEANRMTKLRGSAAFFVSVYKALHKMRAWPMRILLENKELELECSSIMVQNTPYTGGGLMVAPEARLNDGKFDVVVVQDISKMDLMINFPKVYKGKHLQHQKFSLYRSSWVDIESKERLEKTYDGDLGGSTPIQAHVVPHSLKVVY